MTSINAKPPTWYYAAAVIAAVWAMLGCYAYLMQVTMGPAEMAALPAAQREIYAMTPPWVNGVFAIAVWSSLVGGIALLARSKFARWAYVISLIAVVVQFGWTFLATPILTSIGPSAAGFPAFIAIAGVAQLWLANTASARGWLR